MLVGCEWHSGNYKLWVPHDIYNAKTSKGKVITRSDVTFLEHTNFWTLAYRLRKTRDPPSLHLHKNDVNLLEHFMQHHETHEHLTPDSSPTGSEPDALLQHVFEDWLDDDEPLGVQPTGQIQPQPAPAPVDNAAEISTSTTPASPQTVAESPNPVEPTATAEPPRRSTRQREQLTQPDPQPSRRNLRPRPADKPPKSILKSKTAPPQPAAENSREGCQTNRESSNRFWHGEPTPTAEPPRRSTRQREQIITHADESVSNDVERALKRPRAKMVGGRRISARRAANLDPELIRRLKDNTSTNEVSQPDNDPSDPILQQWSARHTVANKHPWTYTATQRTPVSYTHLTLPTT